MSTKISGFSSSPRKSFRRARPISTWSERATLLAVSRQKKQQTKKTSLNENENDKMTDDNDRRKQEDSTFATMPSISPVKKRLTMNDIQQKVVPLMNKNKVQRYEEEKREREKDQKEKEKKKSFAQRRVYYLF